MDENDEDSFELDDLDSLESTVSALLSRSVQLINQISGRVGNSASSGTTGSEKASCATSSGNAATSTTPTTGSEMNVGASSTTSNDHPTDAGQEELQVQAASPPQPQTPRSNHLRESNSDDIRPMVINLDENTENDDIVLVEQPELVLIDLSSSEEMTVRRRRRRINNPAEENRDRSRSPHGVVYVPNVYYSPDVEVVESAAPSMPQVPFANRLSVQAAEPTSAASQPSAAADSLTCAICLDSVLRRRPTSTICGHIFCNKCIMENIRINHQCPLCKKKLNPRQVHPIYL